MPAVSAKPMHPVADSVLIESTEFPALEPKMVTSVGSHSQAKEILRLLPDNISSIIPTFVWGIMDLQPTWPNTSLSFYFSVKISNIQDKLKGRFRNKILHQDFLMYLVQPLQSASLTRVPKWAIIDRSDSLFPTRYCRFPKAVCTGWFCHTSSAGLRIR